MSLSNFKLYEIANEYLIAIDSLLDNPELDPGYETTLAAVNGAFEDKSIAVASYIRNLEIESEAIKTAAKEMLDRAKQLEKASESLRDYLKTNIESTGLTDPIKCNYFTIKLQQNPGALVIDDANLLPDIYKIVKEVVSYDKMAIKKDIEDGFTVEGARIVKNKRLVIK